MYRHIEKDEKKLTDEEIVKALECCTVDEVTDCENCPLLRESCAIIRKYALDLIHCLQAENTRLEMAVDSAYNSIEKIGRNAHGMCTKLEDEKAELQKQVDELTAFKNEAISMSLYGKGRKDGEEVAVKDTAKEICDLILEHWEKKQFVECDWLRVAISEKYGVEVE